MNGVPYASRNKLTIDTFKALQNTYDAHGTELLHNYPAANEHDLNSPHCDNSYSPSALS